MKRFLIAAMLCFSTQACYYPGSIPEPDLAGGDLAPTATCNKHNEAACDEAARCVVVECTEDPYAPIPGACKDPTSNDCLLCAHWARTTSLCHYLFERCNGTN